MSRVIGCRDLHIAPLVMDEAGQLKPSYGAIKRVPSLISISISDSVEQSKFYSDDSVEQSFSKTSSKEVNISLGYITNELESLITGKELDENGVLIQTGSDAPQEVALLFRAPKSKGSDFRYICLYKGTLSRTESEYATQEDSVESSNVALTGTFISLKSNGKMAAVLDTEDAEDPEVIENWFKTVYGANMAPGSTL